MKTDFNQLVNPFRFCLPIRRKTPNSEILRWNDTDFYSHESYEDVPTIHSENLMKAVYRMPVKDVPLHLRNFFGSYPIDTLHQLT